MKKNKKSKYKFVVIKKKKYYFYKITWADITGDAGHCTNYEFLGFMPSIMITHAYLFNKDHKHIRTFASYEENDELLREIILREKDRNGLTKGLKQHPSSNCGLQTRSGGVLL